MNCQITQSVYQHYRRQARQECETTLKQSQYQHYVIHYLDRVNEQDALERLDDLGIEAMLLNAVRKQDLSYATEIAERICAIAAADYARERMEEEYYAGL